MTGLNTNKLQEFYDVSPMRNGIICWYPFKKNATVFEQTNGALTEWLNDRVHTVFSNRRPIEKVDYVIIMNPNEITKSLLCEYREMLKADGHLLLAFDNSFGLEYFSGKRNRRTQLPYSFRHGESKREVEIRLKQAGFQSSKWYYPFPNLYFPKEIYSDNYLPNEFLNHRMSEFLEDDYTKMFDERELWREVIRNGAFEFLANAYFVEAVAGDKCLNEVDYAALTIYREADRAYVTTVCENGTVYKRAYYEEGISRLQKMEEIHTYLNMIGVKCVDIRFQNNAICMERINLPTLWDWWTEKLVEGTLTKELLFKHCDYIRWAIYKANKNGRIYWELVPANCFYDEKKEEITFFDQEFYWENMDPDIALVRALWLLVWSDGTPVFEQTKIWLDELKERYNLTSKWDKLIKIARDQTHKYVFNPDATDSLVASEQKALQRIEKNRNIMTIERNRYLRFEVAADKLKNRGIKNVIVYGNGTRGKTLINVLDLKGIAVIAVLDQELKRIESELVDAILVTPLENSSIIATELRKHTEVEIIILEDLL